MKERIIKQIAGRDVMKEIIQGTKVYALNPEGAFERLYNLTVREIEEIIETKKYVFFVVGKPF